MSDPPKLNVINYLNMKKILCLLSAAALLLAGCCKNGVEPLRTPVPKRPAGQADMLAYAAPPIDTVRVGFVGLGMRGQGAIGRYLHIETAKIAALCDVRKEYVEKAQKTLSEAGLPAVPEYFGDTEVYKQLCERDDIDLVYICTDWVHHAPVALYAMEHGKHVAIEVPAATSLEEIWDLINTSERTRKHCMMLENCCYDFFELATLNMAQHGLFGEIYHGEGAYIHCLAHFWDRYWDNWRLEFNRTHKGDVYPTHGFGPVCQVFDIHRGDQLKTLVSMETEALTGPGLVRKLSPEVENPDDFANADHTMTMIRTAKGRTIQIQHGVMTPRPYNRMYQIVGTEGFANKYPRPGYSFVPDRIKDVVDLPAGYDGDPYLGAEQYEQLVAAYTHPLVKEIGEVAKKVGGHGGMDYMMDYRLIYCLNHGLPLDMDVYDLAEWCCVGPLSALSIENGSAPVEVPDFTRGGQDKVKGFRFAYAQ